MRNKLGFTLVEMLVVISVIGILASVIYASFDGARDQARNKALQSEMKEIQLALEVFRAQNGYYPPTGTINASCYGTVLGVRYAVVDTGTCDTATLADTFIGNTTSLFVPEFIAKLPRPGDSGNSNCRLRYETDDDVEPSWYKLTAENCFSGAENASEGIQPDTEFSRCPSSCSDCNGDTNNAAYVATDDFYESMAVYSAGGQCE